MDVSAMLPMDEIPESGTGAVDIERYISLHYA